MTNDGAIVTVAGGEVLEVTVEVEMEAVMVKGTDVVVVEISVEAAVVGPPGVLAGVLVATDVVLADVAGSAPGVVKEIDFLVTSAATAVVRHAVVAGADVAVAELVETDCVVQEGEEMVVAAGELERPLVVVLRW